MSNAEQRVIDEIDKLVDEQLARGPVDDYGADRYPDCDRCPHNWHGIKCEYCSCEVSGGEVPKSAPALIYPRYTMREGTPYVDQIESVRITDDRNGRRVGYTMADIEAMRGGFVRARPQIRFWGVVGDQLTEIEGTFEPAGNEPQWLHEMVDATLSYLLDQVAEMGVPTLETRERREIRLAIEAGAVDEEAWHEGDCEEGNS